MVNQLVTNHILQSLSRKFMNIYLFVF